MHKEQLYDMLCDELDEIAAKGELTAGSLDTIDKLTHSIKSLATIMAMEGHSNEGSYEGSYEGSNRGGSYARGRSYLGGSNRGNYRGSYARRRDSMGRFSRESGYSMDEQKEHIVEQLEGLMRETQDSNTRMAIEEAVMRLNEMK